MSRRASTLVLLVAALLALVALAAVADVPRCAEDGSRTDAAAFPAAMEGSLSYEGVSGCTNALDASIGLVSNTGGSSTLAKLGNWRYFIAVRSATPAVYVLNAMCGTTVVCQAEVTYAAGAQ